MPEDIFGATADHLDIRHSHWMCGTHFETEKLSILHNNPSFQIVVWNHIYDEVPTVNFYEGSLHQKCVLKRGESTILVRLSLTVAVHRQWVQSIS